MRTTEKDIIMICKGWFNKDKYKDELEALKAYQAEYVGYCKAEDIKDLDVLKFRLFTVAEMFFKPSDWTEMIRDCLMGDMFWNKVNLDYNYLCWLYIRQINSLQVKKDNGEHIIDLSAYDEINEII